MGDTTKTVTVLGRTTKAMVKAAADLAKTAVDLSALATASEELTSEIEFKTSELAAIEDRTSDGLRRAKADLDIKVLENEEGVLKSLLTKRGLATVVPQEFSNLQADLRDALASNEDAINAAVGKAKGMAESKAKTEQRELALQHSVDTAQLEAQNESLEGKNAMLQAQLDDMKEMLTKEREARVAMAANASQPVVNVSSSK